jgi:hypothetical protein
MVGYSSIDSRRRMQQQLFSRKLADRLAPMGSGATAPWLIRADDGLPYIVKDEISGTPLTVRASEFIWVSLARLIGLPAPEPVVIEDETGRPLFGCRREIIAPDALLCLLNGHLHNGGVQLSRIYGLDLFSANWDRHPGNYLVLDDGGGSFAVFAIDFSHVPAHPGMINTQQDPIFAVMTATRQHFPKIVSAYGGLDRVAALQVIDRLALLPIETIETILSTMPNDWLEASMRGDVLSWWKGPERKARAQTLKQGLMNGALI